MHNLPPRKEIAVLNELGLPVNTICYHANLFPGLDADYCPECQTWWVDQQTRDRYFKRKKGKGEELYENEKSDKPKNKASDDEQTIFDYYDYDEEAS